MQRGHFYFGEKGTFLLWVDSLLVPLLFQTSVTILPLAGHAAHQKPDAFALSPRLAATGRRDEAAVFLRALRGCPLRLLRLLRLRRGLAAGCPALLPAGKVFEVSNPGARSTSIRSVSSFCIAATTPAS